MAPYLSVPLAVLELIRSKGEAETLCRINIVAHRFDCAVIAAANSDATASSIRDLTSKIEARGDDLESHNALSTLLAQASGTGRICLSSLDDEIDSCRREFETHQRILGHFIESNLTSAREFAEAGCMDRANVKGLVADIERLLAARLASLLQPGEPGDLDLWRLTMEEHWILHA